jgi:putative ABC transport system substrate-binding protein
MQLNRAASLSEKTQNSNNEGLRIFTHREARKSLRASKYPSFPWPCKCYNTCSLAENGHEAARIRYAGRAVATYPLVARAQPGRIPRIAILMQYPENDPQGQLRAKAFLQELDKLGWVVGKTVQLDFAWGTGNIDWIRSETIKIIRSGPDVMVINGSAAATIAKQSTDTAPIIFIAGGDPVADGLVASLAHPGGNVTGFTVLEPSLGAKLLALLKELKPNISSVAVLFSRDSHANQQTFETAKAAGPKFGVEVRPLPWSGPAEMDEAFVQWRSRSDFCVIVPPDPRINSQRSAIIASAAHYKLPVIYGLRVAVIEGGLISYGVDVPQLFRQTAAYASRVLKGEKAGNLPVQLPTKFELVINKKAADALDLAIPPTLSAVADDVIE